MLLKFVLEFQWWINHLFWGHACLVSIQFRDCDIIHVPWYNLEVTCTLGKKCNLGKKFTLGKKCTLGQWKADWLKSSLLRSQSSPAMSKSFWRASAFVKSSFLFFFFTPLNFFFPSLNGLLAATTWFGLDLFLLPVLSFDSLFILRIFSRKWITFAGFIVAGFLFVSPPLFDIFLLGCSVVVEVVRKEA